MKNMKIVLLQNVPNLGTSGAIVEVKEGYARNFLIPKAMAALRQDPKAQQILYDTAQKKKEQHLKEGENGKIIADLDGKEIVFKVKANKKGKPYFSIKPADIAKKLKIDEHFIESTPLEDLGEYEVVIKAGSSEVKLKVKIEPEK